MAGGYAYAYGQRCRSVKVTPDISDGKRNRPVVSMSIGNLAGDRRSHCEVAWVEMPPGMARQIAQDLIEAAAEAEREGAQQ